MFRLPQEHNITPENGHHDHDTYRPASVVEFKKKIKYMILNNLIY